ASACEWRLADNFLRKFEMHAIDRSAGKPCTPEPAMLVKKRSKLENTALRLGGALGYGIGSEEQINCCSPTVVRERISVSSLVAHAEHTIILHGSDDGGYLLFRFGQDCFERCHSDIKTTDFERPHVDA